MAGAQSRSRACRGAGNGQRRRGGKGRDQGHLAGALGSVAHLLLGRLEVVEGFVDALLGIRLRQAGLLGNQLRQQGAITRVELRVVQVGHEGPRDRRGQFRAGNRRRRAGGRGGRGGRARGRRSRRQQPISGIIGRVRRQAGKQWAGRRIGRRTRRARRSHGGGRLKGGLHHRGGARQA